MGGRSSPEVARRACKKYRLNHPHKIIARARRRLGVPEFGGISLVGVCPICKKAEVLVPDHDHKTNKERGWLCGYCNRFLGAFEAFKKDGRFERMEQYLKGDLYGIFRFSDFDNSST